MRDQHRAYTLKEISLSCLVECLRNGHLYEASMLYTTSWIEMQKFRVKYARN